MSITKADLAIAIMPDYAQTIKNADVTFYIQEFDSITGRWTVVTKVEQKKFSQNKSGKGFWGQAVTTEEDYTAYWKRRSESYWSHRDIAIEAAKLARTKTVNTIRVTEYVEYDLPLKTIWKNGKWMDE